MLGFAEILMFPKHVAQGLAPVVIAGEQIDWDAGVVIENFSEPDVFVESAALRQIAGSDNAIGPQAGNRIQNPVQRPHDVRHVM